MPIQVAPHAEIRRLTIVRAAEASALRTESEIQAFARAVRDGLSARPKTMPFQFFYDKVGSALFEQICQLPEYYLTRTEDAILREHADTMVAGWTEAPTLIELGSGSAEKTWRLIAAALKRYGRLQYVPIDVSASALESSAAQLVRAFSSLRVTGFVGDYNECLPSIVARFSGPKLIAFLGSSLGNYEPDTALALLAKMRAALDTDDRLLLGTDLAKDASLLEPAYNDAQGVTARFNRNLLVRVNDELGADFAPERFQHCSVYRENLGRVEMHLISLTDQTVHISAAGLSVHFKEGESIHTENSHKYRPEALRDLADDAGFVEETAWTDARSWFRVQRWRPRPKGVNMIEY